MPLSVAGQRLFTRKTKLGGATAGDMPKDTKFALEIPSSSPNMQHVRPVFFFRLKIA